jgi:hypothetical protein
MADKSAESTASWFGRLTWGWLNPLMELGSSRPLNFDDVATALRPEMHAPPIAAAFDAAWAHELASNPASPSLVAVFKTLHGRSYALALCMIFLFDICLFVNPLLMRDIIAFVQAAQSLAPTATSTGVGLAIAMCSGACPSSA